VEQSRSLDPGKFAFDQARADVTPVARVGHDTLSASASSKRLASVKAPVNLNCDSRFLKPI
jgi:hypothetical protein